MSSENRRIIARGEETMDQKLATLFDRMKQGPAVVLIGQSHLLWDIGHDPFLSEVLRKFGGDNNAPSYESLLGLNIRDQQDSAISWMQERSSKFSPPSGLATLGAYPWSAVYTSAIDTIGLSSFRAVQWSEVLPITEETYVPDDPRNRHRLYVNFLFGNVAQLDQNRPPFSRADLLGRRQAAIAMLRRLPEVLA